MKMTSFPPSERMDSFVRNFTVVETGDDEATRVLIPDTGVIVGFRFSGSATELGDSAAARLPDAAVTGIRTTARRMLTSPRGGIVLATFREGGAARLLSEPLHELFGQTVALQDLIPRSEVEEARSRIAEAADHRQRIAVFEEFLIAHQSSRTRDPIVDAAVHAIRETRGSLRIGALARHLGVAQDLLEKRFRRWVGASPKQYASIVRLRHAVDVYRTGATLTRASIDSGYFDQSHFNREFRSVTGAAPQQLFRSGGYC